MKTIAETIKAQSKGCSILAYELCEELESTVENDYNEEITIYTFKDKSKLIIDSYQNVKTKKGK